MALNIIQRQHSQAESHHGHALTGSVRITTGVFLGRLLLTFTAMAVCGGNAELVCLGSADRCILNAAEQQKNEDDAKDKSESSARVIAPIPAMRPPWQYTQ